MTTSGDFFVKEGTSVIVNMVKIQEDLTMNISFMDGEVFVAGGDYSIPAGRITILYLNSTCRKAM